MNQPSKARLMFDRAVFCCLQIIAFILFGSVYLAFLWFNIVAGIVRDCAWHAKRVIRILHTKNETAGTFTPDRS